ncbi:SMP-30/gluconolactonase/LRE family protein [Actinokineospora auranticolor]|nr:SMP-30/gluconolactonase/LRE family protein [Actinokineospora auranticolor]
MPRLTVLPVNGRGPEDVLIDDHGHLYTGVDDGRILRLTADGRRLDTIADTGGRPLGLEHHPDGRLLVCDAARGLLLVDRGTGDIELLIPAGADLRVCNNAAVAADGTVYFTNSTERFDLPHWRADLFEHRATGSLRRRSPDGEVEVLLDGLHFANGVALAPDESYVVVVDGWEYALRRVWLTGEKQGTSDVLVDNLPGFPDNISTGTDGLIWIALASPRRRLLDLVLRTPPAVRKLLWRVPERWYAKEGTEVWARAVDGTTGHPVHDFRGPTTDGFHMVTGVREHHGEIYLGSLEATSVAHFSKP